jgi:hypothetical protein
MTLKEIQNDIDVATKKLIGKYCFACNRSRPIDQFDLVAKKSVTKCRDCQAKYGKKK